MDSLHTPGKWVVFEREGRPPFPFEIRVYVGPEDRPTAYRTVATLHSLGHDRWDANLAAAAPDLLAALVNLAEYVEDDNPGAASCDAHVMALLEAAHDAIARARGEASDA